MEAPTIASDTTPICQWSPRNGRFTSVIERQEGWACGKPALFRHQWPRPVAFIGTAFSCEDCGPAAADFIRANHPSVVTSLV